MRRRKPGLCVAPRSRSTVRAVSPLREIWLLLLRELRKSFRSVKGILLLLFTVAGGGGFAHLLAQSQEVRQRRLADSSISPEMMLEAKQKILGWWFTDAKTGEHVAGAPAVLTALFSLSLWLIPAVVLVLGFDAIAGDLQHKSVRYWTLRTRRWSYVTGKFCGLWATCGVVALAMHLLIWVICIARGEATFAQTIGWGFRFWVASLPILGVWCGLSVLVSSLFRIPILALLLTGGAMFAWWLVYMPFWAGVHFSQKLEEAAELGSFVPEPHFMLFAFPNFYDRYLLSPSFPPVLVGLAVTLGFAALCVAASSMVFAKRDV